MEKVFVNCPFDDQYFSMLRAILFTIKYNGLEPLIAETTDGGQTRINNIISKMKEATYSVHDISRIEIMEGSKYPRFNMPFELGIDIGIKNCDPFASKKIVIFDKEKYRYKAVISDISGNDIFDHENNPEILIKKLRNWFFSLGKNPKGYQETWSQYQVFDMNYQETLSSLNLDPNKIGELPFSEIINMMNNFMQENNL